MQTFHTFPLWQCLFATTLLTNTLTLSAKAQTLKIQDFYDTNTDQAVFDQAQQTLNLNPTDLQITQVEPIDWPNGCLGLPFAEICTQAIVPGWRVTLSDSEKNWIFHSIPQQAIWNPTPGAFPSPIQPPPPDPCPTIWPSNCTPSDPNTGLTQDNPFLPTRRIDNGWLIENMPSGRWGDPPMTPGFRYTMVSNSLFSSILDFPTGIDSDNLFTVAVGGQTLGAFGPGESVDFQDLLGQAVPEFTVSGIDPLVDSEDPTAFPLRLAFATPTASFRMDPLSIETTQVPEPNLLLGLGLAMAAGYKLKRKRTTY